MKKILAACALTLNFGLFGCASQPSEIETLNVSTLPYESHTCDQLGLEIARINDRINELYVRLEDKADKDTAAMAVGMVLFWPALFLLEGGDGAEAHEYARLKGEMDALRKVGVKKSCTNLPKFNDPIQKKLEAAKASEEDEAVIDMDE